MQLRLRGMLSPSSVKTYFLMAKLVIPGMREPDDAVALSGGSGRRTRSQ